MIDFKLYQKPQRYIGNEWNVIKKDHDNKIKICLAYPNLYELGMSNLGLRIIYAMLNQFDNIVCERVFMPGTDLINFLKQSRTKLFSLETRTPLDQFNILAFNFNYEMNFTNFLHMLDLSGVPVESKQRQRLIVLGGGILNPEPLTKFVDIFFLGEFEETVPEFVKVLQKYPNREERLEKLSQIDGFYIPKYYSILFHDNKYFFKKEYAGAKLPLRKVHVKNFNDSFYPNKWLTPYTGIIHDRIPVEIARGCPNHCSFCQARALYYPYREKKISVIKKIIEETYRSSGYENLSLLALSASDYSSIEDLIDEITPYCQERKIGLSLPSLRIDDILDRLYKQLSKIKKTSLTVAVEAAREKLRDKLNKKIDINKLFEAAQIIKSLKLRHIKIYFMFGFGKEEEDKDLTAIGGFLDKLSKESRLSLNTNINIFMPKPFSLWENSPMEEEDILNVKLRTILKNIPPRRNIKVTAAGIKKNVLETVLARADREFSSVIHRVFLHEQSLNRDHESFRWDIWDLAMKQENIDYQFYLSAKTDNFPWSFITTN